VVVVHIDDFSCRRDECGSSHEMLQHGQDAQSSRRQDKRRKSSNF
jgi:hypothetical protein